MIEYRTPAGASGVLLRDAAGFRFTGAQPTNHWPIRVATSRLTRGGALRPGESMYSANAAFRLVYQTDGNLVVYRIEDGVALWSTRTFGMSAGRAVMQRDGNLVLYAPDGTVHWSSATHGAAAANGFLTMQSGGNLVITGRAGNVVWATNTGN